MVRTTVPPSLGGRGLGIYPRFPPLREPKVESTCATTWGPQVFYPTSLGLEGLVQPKGLGTLSVSKKKLGTCVFEFLGKLINYIAKTFT